MDLNRYTNKAQQALMAAQSMATEYGHSSIEPIHILAGLLVQEDGVVPQVISKIGARPSALLSEVQGIFSNLPRISGSNVQAGLSRQATDVLHQAEKHAGRMKDDYVTLCCG